MIEVEKRFILNPEQEKNLIREAEFLGEKENIDIYYDDEFFSLTTKDLWLRQRNGTFELKVSMNSFIEEKVAERYEELETEKEILEYFKAPQGQTLVDFLKEKQYKPFCKIITKRKKYKKDRFIIDLDKTDFGYNIAEIELIVKNKSDIDEAEKSITKFAKNNNIEQEGKWGKTIKYISINNTKHLEALLKAKVAK